eukprot:Selendium_serpulae@DN8172_c0_g1_i1.p1
MTVCRYMYWASLGNDSFCLFNSQTISHGNIISCKHKKGGNNAMQNAIAIEWSRKTAVNICKQENKKCKDSSHCSPTATIKSCSGIGRKVARQTAVDTFRPAAMQFTSNTTRQRTAVHTFHGSVCLSVFGGITKMV